MVSSGCPVKSHVAVVVGALAGGDLVQQADGDAMEIRQVPQGGRVSLLDGGDRRPVVPHHHLVDGLPNKLLQKELGGEEL